MLSIISDCEINSTILRAFQAHFACCVRHPLLLRANIATFLLYADIHYFCSVMLIMAGNLSVFNRIKALSIQQDMRLPIPGPLAIPLRVYRSPPLVPGSWLKAIISAASPLTNRVSRVSDGWHIGGWLTHSNIQRCRALLIQLRQVNSLISICKQST